MKVSIVIDLGFGDCGKGVTVDHLSRVVPENSLVVRFSGGHQVGHTVEKDGFRHTFSHFGAGTLQGVPTYYTEHTTLFPPGMLAEYQRIRQYQPQVYAHPRAMITTPYDIAFNRARETFLQHGSCGVGFGTTIARHEQGITLYAMDLMHPWAFTHKLLAIKHYYLNLAKGSEFEKLAMEEIDNINEAAFIDVCQESQSLFKIKTFADIASSYQHIIFEGSQGILLDQCHGIFPHVTRSHTTCKNALEVLRQSQVCIDNIDCYYVTRCYQTRHGNGPMSTQQTITLINTESEANCKNVYQGEFRISEIDPDLLAYALDVDQSYHGNFKIKPHLVITCLDQRPDFQATHLVEQLPIEFASVLGSYSPDAKDFRAIKRD